MNSTAISRCWSSRSSRRECRRTKPGAPLGLLFGLLPALRVSAVAASGFMTAVARGATGGRERQLARRGLVVAQIALALTLLVGSGLALRSFQRLASVDPGFDPVDVLTFGVTLPPRDYDTPDSRLSFYRQVVDRLRALPGADAAAAALAVPLEGVVSSAGYSIEGRPRCRRSAQRGVLQLAPPRARDQVTLGVFGELEDEDTRRARDRPARPCGLPRFRGSGSAGDAPFHGIPILTPADALRRR